LRWRTVGAAKSGETARTSARATRASESPVTSYHLSHHHVERCGVRTLACRVASPRDAHADRFDNPCRAARPLLQTATFSVRIHRSRIMLRAIKEQIDTIFERD